MPFTLQFSDRVFLHHVVGLKHHNVPPVPIDFQFRFASKMYIGKPIFFLYIVFSHERFTKEKEKKNRKNNNVQ